MKSKVFLIVAAIVVALALTAFVVFPTAESGKQETVLTTESTETEDVCEHHCSCSDCMDGGYVVHQDDCKKCYFDKNLYSFYCGKCGSRMNTSDEYKNGYLYTTCTCTNARCNHTCIFKMKF